MKPGKISLIFGTRPEAIKLCPLVMELKKHPEFQVNVCVTGQHREMLDQVLNAFNVVPDVDLNLMQPDQTLAELTSRAITSIDKHLADYKPDIVIVQGDTTTTFCAALAAFYNKIPIGHVEAGLRTRNRYSPFPEEVNRVLTDHIADMHFAPTRWAKESLVKECIDEKRIFVTGNTVIDALHVAVKKVQLNPPEIPGVPKELLNGDTRPLVLITGHRRENFGEGFRNICQAICELGRQFSNTAFVYPVHLNPNVRKPVFDLLSGRTNVHLIEPLSYLPFVALMNRSTLVLTDSGGVQEEAPGMGKPVLVMRDTTERPEAVEAGTAKVIGTDEKMIVHQVSTLLSDSTAYKAMANAVNPYGDGKACERIVQVMGDNHTW
ncbi:MAG: UDP-N-acetylglucosamine 2-epimerase (non-hydrolyzing) [Planctomycetes bacterium B3_Pla]|nr:MAG: UDP-N-acetylglucosamine 2-epimerase (non-hydrolyzing) [Planctomycetes bacterium B3_Pla]